MYNFFLFLLFYIFPKFPSSLQFSPQLYLLFLCCEFQASSLSSTSSPEFPAAFKKFYEYHTNILKLVSPKLKSSSHHGCSLLPTPNFVNFLAILSEISLPPIFNLSSPCLIYYLLIIYHYPIYLFILFHLFVLFIACFLC